MNHREILLRNILKKSYREGDFTLASGQKSAFYIDLKPTILDPRGADAFGELTVEWMKSNHLKFDGVGGLTLGADPLVMAVSLAALRAGIELPATMIRKEPKKHGTSRFIEGVENFKPGATFLVLEDVVTTGGSARRAVEILRAEGFKPLQVLSVVDRESGGEAAFKDLGVPLHSFFKISEIKAAYASK
ncbi:MAG: orotate phosphoribosyltransferase [Bdellovibrionales bacterium]|nr:orotate phosphoribosyltransferase [Bdellovibrionales bacterium]